MKKIETKDWALIIQKNSNRWLSIIYFIFSNCELSFFISNWPFILAEMGKQCTKKIFQDVFQIGSVGKYIFSKKKSIIESIVRRHQCVKNNFINLNVHISILNSQGIGKGNKMSRNPWTLNFNIFSSLKTYRQMIW